MRERGEEEERRGERKGEKLFLDLLFLRLHNNLIPLCLSVSFSLFLSVGGELVINI